MLSTIARLFGKSPFYPLQSHMKKVSSCMKKLTDIFNSLKDVKISELNRWVKELSKLEHEADLTKNDIRKHLPRGLFLPIDRSQFLDILAIQDHLADKTEDVGNLLVLYPINEFGEWCDHFKALFEKNAEAFWDTRNIIKELHKLLASSFGGIEAERVKAIVDQTSLKEHEADKMKHKLMQEFFVKAKEVKTPVFYLYIQIIEEINHISHFSEHLANRILMILELK